MPEKNPLTLALIVVIIIIAITLVCGVNTEAFKNLYNKGKSKFEGAAPVTNSIVQPSVAPEIKEPALNVDIDPTLAKHKAEGKYQDILMQHTVQGANSTGLVSSSNVNSSYELGDQNDQSNVDKYSMDYQDIVNNEIGHDNIKSQQQYSKYVKSDSQMRYLDTDLSANYSNYYGLNLSRGAKADKIAATNSTQIQGIDPDDYDQNQANIRQFYTQNQQALSESVTEVAAKFANKNKFTTYKK